MTKPSTLTRDTYHVGNLASLLLEAAREMLEEVGPAQLSLRAVSKRVGVSSAATYHHYANRADLIGHLAAQGFRELAKVFVKTNVDRASLQSQRNISVDYFNFARSNPALYQLMFGPEFASGEMIPELRAAREEAFSVLKRSIADYLEQDLDSGEVRRASLAGWSFIHGLSSLALNNALQVPAGTSDESFVDRTLQGLQHLLSAWNK